MLISIITIVRNDRTGLAKTVRSVESQTFRDFEWLVIDGASTDGTAEDALAIKLRHASVTSEPDNGIFDAMNKGLDRAQGQFVLFLNAGDIFSDEGTLAHVAPVLLRGNVDILYGDSLEQFAGQMPIYKPARGHRKINSGMFACHQTMYYRRSVIGPARYDAKFRIAGDYDFTARILKKSSRVEWFKEALCVFDLTGASIRQRQQGRRENWEIQRDVLHQPVVARLLIQLRYHVTAFVGLHLPTVYKALRYRARHG